MKKVIRFSGLNTHSVIGYLRKEFNVPDRRPMFNQYGDTRQNLLQNGFSFFTEPGTADITVYTNIERKTDDQHITDNRDHLFEAPVILHEQKLILAGKLCNIFGHLPFQGNYSNGAALSRDSISEPYKELIISLLPSVNFFWSEVRRQQLLNQTRAIPDATVYVWSPTSDAYKFLIEPDHSADFINEQGLKQIREFLSQHDIDFLGTIPKHEWADSCGAHKYENPHAIEIPDLLQLAVKFARKFEVDLPNMPKLNDFETQPRALYKKPRF